MPRKKKSNSASLANLRPGANFKHGGYLFCRSGEVPPGNDDIKAELKDFYERTIAMYCPDGKPNPHQEKLLRRAVHKLGFCILCETDAWERGPIQQNENGKSEMLPSLGKQYIAFANGFRLDMRELREISVGKGRKDDLQDYLETTYGDKAKKG